MPLELSGDIAGLGKIVQIVRATDSTQRQTTSTSFVDADISVTITPKKVTSAILLVWSTVAVQLTAGQNTYLQISDSSNNPISGAEASQLSNSAGNVVARQTIIGYATPATTSATTYKGRFRVTGGTGRVNNAGESTGQLFAIEVAA
jgi:hypothetical protein